MQVFRGTAIIEMQNESTIPFDEYSAQEISDEIANTDTEGLDIPVTVILPDP